MQKRFRLTGSKRFSIIRLEGKSWANRFLVLKMASNDLPETRIGFAVGKRIGIAVARNKIKRRLKEIVRLTQLKAGWDILFIARRRSPKIQYQELKLATEDLLQRARVILPTNNRTSAAINSAELDQSRTSGEANTGTAKAMAASPYHGSVGE